MKHLLVINAHPDPQSYNRALSEAYVSGLDRGKWVVEILNLADLQFNPILQHGYRKRTEFEPDLVRALDLIRRADHLAWFFPVWWYGLPAVLKGFIDRTFLPGIAFEYVEQATFPNGLFSGKTAQLVITADTPRWYDRFIMGSPAITQFKKGTLEFCGIEPVRVTYIAPIRHSTEAFRAKWVRKVWQLGRAT
jgi:putative NADPH-quinone reductase